MATYTQIFALRFGGAIADRVIVAVATAAQQVLAEAPSTVNHTARVAWAKLALKDAALMADEMMWGVVGNPTIQNLAAGSTDNDIQFVVNSLIDTFAV